MRSELPQTSSRMSFLKIRKLYIVMSAQEWGNIMNVLESLSLSLVKHDNLEKRQFGAFKKGLSRPI